MVSVFGDGGGGMAVGVRGGVWVGVWMGVWVGGAEVRVSGGVRVKGCERWADRGHDGHDGHGDVKRRVVVRGSEAVVIVGGRQVAAASTRPQLMRCGEWPCNSRMMQSMK